MTVIVINAVSVREGGSLVVLRELLPRLLQQRPHWHWLVVTNDIARASLPAATAMLAYHVVTAAQLDGWRIRLWYETALPALLETANADLLYSQTNYLPAAGLRCPALLLVQHAGHFSPLFQRLTERQSSSWLATLSWRMKGRWVRSSVRRATRVTVQTAALAHDIAAVTGVDANRIAVIAHGPGLAPVGSIPMPTLPAAGAPLRIGYVTKAGVQKNFGVVLQAVQRLRRQGRLVTLVLTLDPALPENRAVLAEAERLGLDGCLDNRGELDADGVRALYRSLHAFVFASLCESFGFPLVEAMAHALPLCIADTAASREVAGDAGLWFGADDAEALAGHLRLLADDPVAYGKQVQLSLTRSAAFSWHTAAERNVALIENLLATVEQPAS
ncbi:MAG TPA: glycosyltransferase [Candidatus Acidoferrum sp.]|nr:glycosyltransferase [Candidatus Acidoferrum sp.]